MIETGRFGKIEIGDADRIHFPQGLLGLSEYKDYCLIDPGDDTLIVWLQSLDQPAICFPLLEPKIFRPDYSVQLSAAELRELKLDGLGQTAVFSILTIPPDVTQMTANLKAPVVINLKAQVAKQVVLQENIYSVRHLMFKELRQHLITIAAQQRKKEATGLVSPVAIRTIPPSLTIRSLQV